MATQNSINNTAGSDMNFAGFKAIAMSCDNGATVPTSPTPTVGQWFLHTPTGRKVLMQYDGSVWVPIMNIGATTIYVDLTNGTDDTAHGTAASASAYKTIQYAIDNIGGMFGGNIVVNLSGETFFCTGTTTPLVLRNKRPIGDYTIGFVGHEAAVVTGTASSGAATTLTDSSKGWTTNAYKGLRVVTTGGTGPGQTRIIKSNNGTVLTVDRAWGTNPANDTTYEIRDNTTEIRGSTAGAATTPAASSAAFISQETCVVSFTNINFAYSTYANLSAAKATINLASCRFYGNGAYNMYIEQQTSTSGTLNTFYNAGNATESVRWVSGSSNTIYWSYFFTITSATSNQVSFMGCSSGNFNENLIDGGATGSRPDGLYCTQNSYVYMYVSVIVGCNNFIKVDRGGQVERVSGTYTGNTATGITATAASYGYGS